MISSVPIHHNSFSNELLWRSHFPVKQESLDDSATTGSPEIYTDTSADLELDPTKSRPDHHAHFIPPSISTSPNLPAHPIYISPNYQQRDLSSHFRMSPNRISPYPMKGSPTVAHHKTSPHSILSSPSPSSLYHPRTSPANSYQSTPDKSRISPQHSDLYSLPNIGGDFHRSSPTSHILDRFQSSRIYPHLPPSQDGYITDIYRSLNFQLPKVPVDGQSPLTEEPLNMNSKTLDLSSSGGQRLSQQSMGSSAYVGDTSPFYKGNRASPMSAANPCSPTNQRSHDSVIDSRSPSPVQNLKKASCGSTWNPSSNEIAAPVLVNECNDVPSLKCYFCSYNTKSRIQLNKHMRDAHNESQIVPFQSNKESINESEEDNENETHSNLSEDFTMDEYDEEDGDSGDFPVSINKATPNTNNNKRSAFKCKKCTLTFKDKDEYYVHQKENHIKPEKLLACKLCPFVTEYKHHHEYHIKNHFKMKPFKCNYSNCKYSCNNQSMLNSHVKSHKSFYQFHCKNCNYATKYMHSFKLHLRKNNHEKGITLNEDGSVNNDIIIDIHGTRRGPKRKSRKLDDIALQNINNNNCITETIKKTIHHEPESEYNNNITMNSNNCSRSNSPLSNANINNNNNDSYYLNTKLFVYSQMATMINEKTPEIWPKDFSKTKVSMEREVVDLCEEQSEMMVDSEVPLDLTKSVESKPQSIIEMVKNSYAREIGQNSNHGKAKMQFSGKSKFIKNQQPLIRIENKTKTSADMIRIVGKNNFQAANKNKIKLCKNNEKSPKHAIDKFISGERQNGEIEISEDEKFDASIEEPIKVINDTSQQANNHQTDDKHAENANDMFGDNVKKISEDACITHEAQEKMASSNKNRRRKGKAYKLQINNNFENNDTNDISMDEENKEEEENKFEALKLKNIHADYKEAASRESTVSKEHENIQIDYLKQIQNQYMKTFQQTKCVESFGLPLYPPLQNSILSHLNNNVSPTQVIDSKSQGHQDNAVDFVDSHLKNLERINAHLFQKSFDIGQHAEGLNSADGFNQKTDTQSVLSSFLNKRNEINANRNRVWYKCDLCDIQYLDELIYSIHMRYHTVEHPYKCNLCGLQTSNKLQFNLHIIQTPHLR